MDIKVRLADVSAAMAGRLAAKAADAAARHMGGSLVPARVPANAANECEQHGCEFIAQIEEGGTTWLLYYCPDKGEYVLYKAD